jgi:alkylated DNA repair protein (DNA oxidative demethylase)
MIDDLFSDQNETQLNLAEGAFCLRHFALPVADQLYETLKAHFKAYPPQQMMTPMGYKMSVRTTSFGQFGWVGTKGGYGYSTTDPVTKKAWPAIPSSFLVLAKSAAKQAGYRDFEPDTCLVNVYEVGSKMGLHQDKDEQDFTQPIVSVSLGLAATFQFGGLKRQDKPRKLTLSHGDVVVWGGKSRMCFHGVLPLKAGEHPLLGQKRINLTFRKAGKM